MSLKIWSWCWCQNSPAVKQDLLLKRDCSVWKQFIRWVGIFFGQIIYLFLFYTSRWWSGMAFFGLWVLYSSRLSRLWTPPIPGWIPPFGSWSPPIQGWMNSRPMKRLDRSAQCDWWCVRLAEWSKAAGSSPVTLNMSSGVRIPHLTKSFNHGHALLHSRPFLLKHIHNHCFFQRVRLKAWGLSGQWWVTKSDIKVISSHCAFCCRGMLPSIDDLCLKPSNFFLTGWFLYSTFYGEMGMSPAISMLHKYLTHQWKCADWGWICAFLPRVQHYLWWESILYITYIYYPAGWTIYFHLSSFPRWCRHLPHGALLPTHDSPCWILEPNHNLCSG